MIEVLKVEEDGTCTKCEEDLMEALVTCSSSNDIISCVMDLVATDCISCACDYLGIQCVDFSMEDALEKVEEDGSCAKCEEDLIEALVTCSSSNDIISCVMDLVATDCISCVCDYLGIQCVDFSMEDALEKVTEPDGDVVQACMECAIDIEKVVQECIAAGGAKDVIKCFVDDFPQIDTCIDCACEALEAIGVNCEEVKSKIQERNESAAAVMDNSCAKCQEDLMEALGTCSSSNDIISCVMDLVAVDCISCVCDYLGIQCMDFSLEDALDKVTGSDTNGDVISACMECVKDGEKVINECISAGGAKDIVKCFVDDFPQIDTCIDCICEALGLIGVDCEEVKSKYQERNKSAATVFGFSN